MKKKIEKVVIIEKDEFLKEILKEHISDFFKNNSDIDFYNAKNIDDILNLSSIDILIVNYLDVFEKIQTLKRIQHEKTNNIIIIFNNLQDRHKNKYLINFKFVVKPFKLKNLFLIISDYFTDFNLDEQLIYLSKNLIFKPEKKIIINDNSKSSVHLTEKENKLFKYLYENRNKIISKKMLLYHVWDFNENIKTHTLETHVYRLKKKIEKIQTDVNFSFVHQKGGYSINFD